MKLTVLLSAGVVGVAIADYAVRAQAPPGAAPPSPAAADAREQNVRQFREGYFRSWSRQDLQRYGQCFLPQAAVQVIDPAGRLGTMPLSPFLKSQQLAQRDAKAPMTETPESIDVRFEGKLARAVVHWKLVDSGREEWGYDHFTLMETAAGWRIANLIFYSEPPKK
jgi:hypothetical protein